MVAVWWVPVQKAERRPLGGLVVFWEFEEPAELLCQGSRGEKRWHLL